MDELADDFAHRWSMKEYKEGTPDFRPGFEGIKQRNKSENLYKSPDFKFEFKNPPVIKKYKKRTSKKKIVTKKYINKNTKTKKYKPKNTKKYKPKNTRKYKY